EPRLGLCPYYVGRITYNTPVVAIYADYKTRWPAMADVSESVVVGQKIDNISLDEFAKALKSVLARI
ncbi:hypothetical protein K3Q41_003140, partial [Escherichia coli]|nr:hypothetical protein [Escherichia coli]HDX3207012.1 hypothetical protein [Escherichia coli]